MQSYCQYSVVVFRIDGKYVTGQSLYTIPFVALSVSESHET